MNKIEFSLNDMASLARWLPIETPPDTRNGERYLVVLTDGSVDAALHYGKGHFCEISHMAEGVDVLFWAELPIPPRIAAQKVTIINDSTAANESLMSAAL